MSDKWAEHKKQFCGCKDGSRLNSCKGLPNCELRAGHPERKTQSSKAMTNDIKISREHVERLAERLSKAQMFKESSELRALLAADHCETCDDYGQVGNILNAEPCPDCAAPVVERQPEQDGGISVTALLQTIAQQAQRIADLETAPVVERQPVAWMAMNPDGYPVRCTKTDPEGFPVYREQPAPVAVGREAIEAAAREMDRLGYGHHESHAESILHASRNSDSLLPAFAQKVIGKLRRFQECTDDGQGADIGRHWFDILTQLGLLNRVQRSPALWEMTQQGEDCLDKVKELNQ